MSYQYLFCATCGLRRMGHGLRCSVCNSLLRRPNAAQPIHVSQPLSLEALRRAWQDLPEADRAPAREPVAA
jgi:hypothetical protein